MKIGELFIKEGLITKQQIDDVLKYQQKYGGRFGWIITTLGYIRRIDFFRVLAKYYNLPFIEDIEEVKKLIDKKLIKNFDPENLAQYEVIPAKAGQEVLIFTSNPNSLKFNEFINNYFPNKKINQIVITDIDLIKLLEFYFKEKFIDKAVHGLFYLTPEYSASKVFSKGQVFIIALFLYISLVWIYYDAVSYFIFSIALTQFFYVVIILFKFIVSLAGAKSEMEQYITEEEIKSISEKDLPVYTILVPVYKEPETIGILINSLKKINYPQNKLDIILLFEEDDKQTLETAKEHKPPSNFRFIVVPNSTPKTKPKACNYGLFFARGKYLTIYDAEDIPESDQLLKAVLAFKKGGDNYICFQSALNYFNRNENFLTKMFTLEYSYWFDYLLPGLYNLKLPIPLGGTSNHFNVEKLREIGAWDPFNTTEDADIGVRAFGKGYKVGVINSTTYEEANSKVRNWIRQRSRWIKGYMQTWLVHVRNSQKLYKTIGFRGFLAFHLLIGGTPFAFLVNPVMWFLFVLWLLSNSKILDIFFPPTLLYISIFNFLFGNFIGVYLNMISVFRRKYFRLLPYALLNPIYWLLHSYAAYKALFELFTKPFYWQKTQHGITKYKPLIQQSLQKV